MTVPGAFAVHGSGVAALAATVVMMNNHVSAEAIGQRRTGPRFLKLNSPTISLIEDLFGCDLAGDLPSVACSTKVVDWTDDVGPVLLADGGLIVARDALLRRITARTNAVPVLARREKQEKYIVRASGRRANANLTASSGRMMMCWDSLGRDGLSVLDKLGTDTLVRAADDGWVFLARAPDVDTFAQVATLTPNIARASKMLAEVLWDRAGQTSLPPPDATFGCSPAIGRPVVEDRCLECGDAAVAFDPICGDGLGNAVRSGVLAACSLLRMAAHPHEQAAILANYRDRMLRSYVVHIDACAEAYSGGRFGLLWRNFASELGRQSARLRTLLRPKISYSIANGGLIPIELT